MRLIEVHIVRAKATQRAVDRLVDVFARQAMVVLTRLPHGEIDLGEDLQAFASLAFEGLTQNRLRFGIGVGVCGVEGGDADVQSLPHTGKRLVLFDLRPMR